MHRSILHELGGVAEVIVILCIGLYTSQETDHNTAPSTLLRLSQGRECGSHAQFSGIRRVDPVY